MLWYKSYTSFVCIILYSLWLSIIPLFRCTTFCVFIHQFTDIWAVFPFLDIMNNASVNI